MPLPNCTLRKAQIFVLVDDPATVLPGDPLGDRLVPR